MTKSLKKPLRNTLIVFFISISLTCLSVYGIFSLGKQTEKSLVFSEAQHIRSHFENAYIQSLTAVSTISFLVQNELNEAYFDKISKTILSSNNFINALQINRSGTIIQVYPVKGHESIIGVNIKTIPKHKLAIDKMLKSNSLVFEGPFELKQGGTGMIGRFPIFKNDTLYGMASVVIMRDSLLNRININKKGNSESFTYSILHREADGQMMTFFDDPQGFENNNNQVGRSEFKDWVIQVKMKDPGYKRRVVIFIIVGIVFSITASLLTWTLSFQPIKFKYMLSKRTRELRCINSELEIQTNLLTKTNSELEQFVYIASHDLKEPLRTITNFLQILEKKYHDQIDTSGRQYINLTISNVNRMKLLIDDILELSGIGKQTLKIEEVDLNSVIMDVMALNMKQIQDSKAKIEFEKLPNIQSNKKLLFQIFHNLIGNSIKYKRPDIDPIIRISIIDQTDNWLFSVSDNGIGVDQEYYEKIFLIFQRLHNRTEFSGNGIGLSIVQKAVDALGGKIWIESAVNKGSIFYFTVSKK